MLGTLQSLKTRYRRYPMFTSRFNKGLSALGLTAMIALLPVVQNEGFAAKKTSKVIFAVE
jgi:hypothetical protein